MKHYLFACTALATLLVTGAASAAKVNYFQPVIPENENVPPALGAGTPPSGRAEFTFDDVTKKLCGRVTYMNLTSPLKEAHMHQAPVADFLADGPVIATFTNGASPLTIGMTLTADQATALAAKRLYVNIHTNNNTGGEIRGNLVLDEDPFEVMGEVPCPASPADAGADSGNASSSGNPSSSSGGTDSGTTSSSGGDESSSGDPAPEGDGDTEDQDAFTKPKSGCSSTGTVPSGGIALLLGTFAAASAIARSRKNAKKG